MPGVRFSFMRATPLLIVALAAMLLIFAGSDSALAHEFNPAASGSVSDPTPGANADLTVTFALDAPGSLPTDDPPTILWVPRQWGISNDAPLGAIGGVFDALATLGILGITPCTFSVTFAPTMYVASTDTSNPTSALDLPGHPGGMGYSGQFAPDPDYEPDMVYGGESRYPDFLTEMFPPDQVGEPLMRLWGGQNVLLSAVSMNILIFEPGQLPEDQYPAEWGYPVVFVLLNPVAPPDLLMLTITSDLCSDLSLVNTHFGLSKDNPDTAADEGGIPLLTNPKWEGDYTFTLKTTSMPDADYPPDEEHGDGIENSLDTCPFDRNTEDLDGDGLDDACDPDPLNPSPPDPSGLGIYDEDQDNYGNRADNCPLNQNGTHIDMDSIEMKQVGGFVFPYAEYWGLIGPDNQADADGDDIGDACEGSEHGGPLSDAKQCANDDDDDGAVNDGCPRVGDTGESGAECDNAIDDDGDAVVNDGCPAVDAEGERFIPTGRIYTVTLTFTVPIYRHGVTLDKLKGKKKVASGGSAEYTVTVGNVSDTYPEDIPVGLRVLPAGCATVNGEPDVNHEVAHVVQSRSGVADFTVDWTGCPDGEYTVQADACHAGDPAPAGFFGFGACPGTPCDGGVDTNPKNDVAMSIIVNVR